MTDLIARLESAQEGSRELSDQVLLACGWTLEPKPKNVPFPITDLGLDWVSPDRQTVHPEWGDRPDPTRDLNDALQLLPKKHKGLSFIQWSEDTPWQVEAMSAGIDIIEGQTLALAVSALAVALSHQNQGEEVG